MKMSVRIYPNFWNMSGAQNVKYEFLNSKIGKFVENVEFLYLM